jgi:hypothetical protein
MQPVLVGLASVRSSLVHLPGVWVRSLLDGRDVRRPPPAHTHT